ncbi:response regulator [Rhodobacter sp. SGA-6-6]|uniref:ATP-binding response regulator n=1 Tax=Rhodobacter sp. SGA-6-6 TaxID=2710882 RepID=UPI0013EA26AA|nr:hybrid sensor histidine kinase/response regulator [Rhodobacter sp. SGA-6-6]NGM45989.1 response regulator [Rhodobacter sp. SGA-6-6]
MSPLPAQRRRRVLRLLAALCIVLVPPLGAQLALGAYPGAFGASKLLLSIIISSVVVHLVLLDLARGPRSGPKIILASILGLLAAPGMPLLSWIHIRNGLAAYPPAPGDTLLSPASVAVGWTAGILMALACRALRHLIAGLQRDGLPPLPHPLALGSSAVLLGVGFWLALSAAPLLEGGTFAPAESLVAALSGLYALMVAALIPRAAADLDDPMSSLPNSIPLLAGMAALALAALATATPEIAALGTAGSAMLLLLTGTMLAGLMTGRPVPLLTLGLMLAGAALPFTGPVTGGSLTAQAILAVLLVSILIGAARRELDRNASITRIDDPPRALLARFSDSSESWIARLDLDERIARFPFGCGTSPGQQPRFGTVATFADLFGTSGFSGILDLLELLQKDGGGPRPPVRVQMTLPAPGGGDRPAAAQDFEVHVLDNRPPVAWVAIVSLRRPAEPAARAARYEKLLAEAMLREERLLSIASHELRTPLAILSMLAEELKAGSSWDEVGPSFEKTLARLVSILDDLRADSGAEGGQAAGAVFTVRELAMHLLDVFRPPAVANGIDLLVDLGAHADTPIRGDQGRVFIALSKLIHNAIVHSKGSMVLLQVFLVPGREGEMTATWQVIDDGIGIGEGHRDRIFDPFETAGADTDAHPGLGLYTARKAIRLIGGDLVLHSEGKGSRFVVTHPARSDQPLTGAEQEPVPMNDIEPIYPDRSALLIEDNKLVGEITSARLRKLFHKVDWAETGDGGLEMFRAAPHDFIVVDQLLPGMIGSQVVREIRKTHKDVPIIGITASTMGSECQELEEAGATYALEKPLSFAQLKGLADEFFASGRVAE